MRVASILSLSYPLNSVRLLRWNGNVLLHPRRGKLDHLFYNPLQAIEFRVYHVIG